MKRQNQRSLHTARKLAAGEPQRSANKMKNEIKEILHVQIRTSRMVVLVMTLLIFVLLGSWGWIEVKTQPISLFDLWGDAIRGLSTDLGRVACGEILLGLLYLIVWTLGYMLISATLGWIIAAIVAVTRELK